MLDRTLFGLLVSLFAIGCTLHVATVYGLAKRPPRTRALIAFFVPPYAAFEGFRAGLRGRAMGLAITFGLYGVVRLLAAL